MGLLSFIRTRVGEGRRSAGSRPSDVVRIFGLPVANLGWAQALSKTEEALSRKGTRTELSFLDDRALLRQFLDDGYRAWLADQTVLPSRGTIAALAAFLSGVRLAEKFAPETFVPALLTYAERPLRILLVCGSGSEDDRLREWLQAHAPWHEIILSAGGVAPHGEAVDMVVVAKPDPGVTDRVRLASIPAGLIVFAGPRLRRIAEVTEKGQGRSPSVMAPSTPKSRAA